LQVLYCALDAGALLAVPNRCLDVFRRLACPEGFRGKGALVRVADARHELHGIPAVIRLHVVRKRFHGRVRGRPGYAQGAVDVVFEAHAPAPAQFFRLYHQFAEFEHQAAILAQAQRLDFPGQIGEIGFVKAVLVIAFFFGQGDELMEYRPEFVRVRARGTDEIRALAVDVVGVFVHGGVHEGIVVVEVPIVEDYFMDIRLVESIDEGTLFSG